MVGEIENAAVEIGDVIKQQREAKRWSLDKLAQVSGVRRDAIWKIEDKRVRKPQGETIERLSAALDVDLSTLATAEPNTLKVRTPSAELGPPILLGGDIPEWETRIAAGQWIDAEECAVDPDTAARVVRLGMFIVRVYGDSMQPAYPPGCRVLFQIIRLDEGGPVVGRDYYWQNSDGQCTLKRFAGLSDDSYVLEALNRVRYPDPILLPRQMLARLAHVVGRLERPY